MTILSKYIITPKHTLRDVRTPGQRSADYMGKLDSYAGFMIAMAVMAFAMPEFSSAIDVVLLAILYYGRWWNKRPFILPFKFPKNAGVRDSHNPAPGKGGAGKAEGILYLGNLSEDDHPDDGRELWLTNTDARTHMLFLGTTGSGKTEGLKSIVANSLAWGSGFVYVDGKADTDLWASLYSLARRFGRDDDLLVLNYMTANSDNGAMSNTMNPFANGSSSYLTNMVTSLMPDAGGDNAMWKERAVALLGALMPALTWKRDRQGLLLDVSVLREYIELSPIIRLSRDPNLPERIVKGMQGYLSTLPGYVDAAFDDEGNERPPSPDQPMYDLQVARQQHGYLSMQFTRSLQSLGDEYGYIFKAQLADVDVLDVVLNRRILVALIPSLEKSGDEAANLGKIIAASLKGMMGATLGNTVEGSWENAIGSKQTRSNASFLTVFDEVGYYTAQGMAVMAAQARSLGFSLIFAAQDLPSMEKRVKQEAQSILGNCNLKIFGKLEDPTATQEFFEKHVGNSTVMETRGMTANAGAISSMFTGAPIFYDDKAVGGGTGKKRASYDALRKQREGEVHMLFAEYIVRARLFYAVPDKVKALRVQRLLPVPPSTTSTAARERALSELSARLRDPDWSAAQTLSKVQTPTVIAAMAQNSRAASGEGCSPLEAGLVAVTGLMNIAAGQKTSAPQAAVAEKKKEDRRPSQREPVAPSSQAETLRVTDVPPLRAGDEFAVEGTESPSREEKPSPTTKPVAPPSQTGAIASRDVDMDIVPTLPSGAEEEEAFDIHDVGLSDEVKALMKRFAGKLNEKLSALTKKTADEE